VVGISPPKPKTEAEPLYLREHAAAKLLGVSASALRSWRSKRRTLGPPVTKVGKMVLYSVKELERFMDERTSRRQ
jgi:DNA-binding transcriptional MerR regulator